MASIDTTPSGPGPTHGAQVFAEAKGTGRLGDKVFSRLATGSGILILVVLAGVAAFLLGEAMPAITTDSSTVTNPNFILSDESLVSYIAPLVFGTVLAAVIAIVLAVPAAVAVALFITHIAPKRIALTLSYIVDLLAAIPSIVYGLWGIAVLGPSLVSLTEWLTDKLGFIPFFDGPASTTGRTMFTVGIVLAVMILPIISAVAREVFTQTPRKLQEGAMALGATRWEMIRMTVLPFGKSAVISGAMLGLGRALGETMAVAIILSATGVVTFDLISSSNPSTIAGNVALQFPESSGLDINVLVASGLVLFAITFIVNMGARAVIARSNVQ